MGLVFAGLALLVLLLNINHYTLTEKSIRATIKDSSQADALLSASGKLINTDYSSKFSFARDVKKSIAEANGNLESGNDAPTADSSNVSKPDPNNKGDAADAAASNEKDSSEQNAGIASQSENDSSGTDSNDGASAETSQTEPIDTDITTVLIKNSVEGPLQKHNKLFLWLVIGLFSAGSILFSLAKYLSKPPGIKNNNVFKKSISSKGIAAMIVGLGLIGFYCVLYWYPYLLADLIKLVDPLSYIMSGEGADDGFLY